MTLLTMGANAPIPSDTFEVTVRWRLNNPSVNEIDVSAFILGASGKVSSDADMVFYGQRRDVYGAVQVNDTNRPVAGGMNEASFQFNLSKLPANVEKVAISGTIMEAAQKRVSFNDVASLVVSVMSGTNAEVIFDVPVRGMSEAALILAELYKRNGQWKFRAVGQGFNGGLKPLAESMGVHVTDDPAPAASRLAPPAPAPSPVPITSPTVSLSKISLTKDKPSVSLAKKGASFGEIKVNLNWNKGQKSGGLLGGIFGGGQKSVDLDLACLYELQNGDKGLVQALGNMFGSFNSDPYAQLMGDDRTGANSDGEWLRINGQHWSKIKRLLIYTFIYDGVANWTQTDGVVTVYIPEHPPIEVKLDGGASNERLCSIALLENENGEIKVNREVRYFASQRPLDQHHRWGLQWTAGRK